MRKDCDLVPAPDSVGGGADRGAPLSDRARIRKKASQQWYLPRSELERFRNRLLSPRRNSASDLAEPTLYSRIKPNLVTTVEA
jgi:hypothetical protein